jgi:hypothetical protein
VGDVATCRRYDRGTCAAGEDPDAYRDAELRLPCVVIRGITSAISCDLRELPAVNDQVVPAGRLTRALDQLERRLCPECGDPIESELDAGAGRVVAVPCHHNLRSRL